MSFKDYMKDIYSKEELQDMVERGCDSGFGGLTYYSDTVILHDKFEDEIWDKLYEDAESMGNDNIMAFIADFNGAKNVGDLTQLKNLLVWWMAEEIARELTEEGDI